MNHRARKDLVAVPNQSHGENLVPCGGLAPVWDSVLGSNLLQERFVPGRQKPEMHDRWAPDLAAQRRCATAGLRHADPVSMAHRVPQTCNFSDRAFYISIPEGAGNWTRKA